MGEMGKIPWHFFKIPRLFPDLEKFLFFPDISLTRGNPDTFAIAEMVDVNLDSRSRSSVSRQLDALTVGVSGLDESTEEAIPKSVVYYFPQVLLVV